MSKQDGYQLEDDGEDEVNPICGSLYETSAKCNRHMNNGEINVSSLFISISLV